MDENVYLINLCVLYKHHNKVQRCMNKRHRYGTISKSKASQLVRFLICVRIWPRTRGNSGSDRKR